jgi:hypothetical protein
MNIKKGLVCLSIIAIVTLSIPNVVAAPAGKQAINIHSSYATDAPVKAPTALVIQLSSNTTAVNKPVIIYGALVAGEHGTKHYIGGATITIQQLTSTNGTVWTRVGTLQTTAANNEVGASPTPNFSGSETPAISGYYVIRATYDGDSNYAPAVSNVVSLTVS